MNTASVVVFPQEIIDRAINETALHLRKIAGTPVLNQPDIGDVSEETHEEVSQITDAAMIKLEKDLRADFTATAKNEIARAFQLLLKKHKESQGRINSLMAKFTKTRTRVQEAVARLSDKNKTPHLARLDAMEEKYREDIMKMLAKHQGEMVRIIFSPYGLKEETISAILASLPLA